MELGFIGVTLMGPMWYKEAFVDGSNWFVDGFFNPLILCVLIVLQWWIG